MLITHTDLGSRIKKIFPQLAQKYHLPEEVSQSMMRELADELMEPQPDGRTYQSVLKSVIKAWKKLKKHRDKLTYPVYFAVFVDEVDALASSTTGLPKERRHMTALFAAAVRRSRYHRKKIR